MRISEVVTPHRQGALFSDVQLRAYWDPERNRTLAKTYIFTTGQTHRGVEANRTEVGSVELLERIVRAFQPSNASNRMMAIANYGHGKSHFAIAAANYFGKPTDSDEFNAVIASFAHAANDNARTNQLKAFREHQKPYFIVILQGDEPTPLPTKLMRAIDHALQAHPETAGIRPPFWFADAERFLEAIDGSKQGIAESFLAEQGFDLATLIARVKSHEDGMYDLCRELHRELYGTLPDFQGSTRLNDIVGWLATEISGPGKPFAGTLLIFDEFTAFLSVYGAGGRRDRHAAPLQDLLNGVQDHRGKVALVAFGNRDPREQAETEFPGADGTSITKELERIETRVQLRSVLEQVLDSYLQQNDEAWDAYPELPTVRRAMEEASDITYSLFRKRYAEQLKWDIKRLRADLAWGCFPLHPMTAAAFSTVSLSATANTRSVIQFIDNALARVQDVDVLSDGRVNWIWPVEMVDYFGEMLSPRLWRQYDDVRSHLSGDITDSESLVLKAMLMIAATNVPAAQVGYVKAVAAFCGVSEAEAEKTLISLAQRNLIQQTDHPLRFAFWTMGSSASAASLLARKRNALPSHVSGEVLRYAVAPLQTEKLLPSIEPTLGLGAAGDWAADQRFVTVLEAQKPGYFVEIAKNIRLTPLRTNLSRSLAIWIVPSTEAEVEWCKTRLLTTLDESFGDSLVPLMVLWPRETVPGVIDAVRDWRAVSGFSYQEIEEVSKPQYEQMLDITRKKLHQAFNQFLGQCEVTVPRFAREHLTTRDSRLASTILDTLYRLAFRDGPGSFFPDYGSTSTSFNRSVSEVALALADDSLGGHKNLYQKKGPSQTLIERSLRQSWELVGPNYRIQEPGEKSPIRPGWLLLESSFAPGCNHVPLTPVLERLLNPPYGYDIRTLPLLFSAWWGLHRQELMLYRNDLSRVSLDEILTKGSQRRTTPTLPDFINALGTLRVSRRDKDQVTTEADAIVRALRRADLMLTEQEAQEHLAKLLTAIRLAEANGVTAKVPDYRAGVKQLNELLGGARDYHQAAQKILADVETAQTVRQVLPILTRAAALKAPGLIGIGVESPEQIRDRCNAKLQRLHELTCVQSERLSDLRKHDTQLTILTTLRGLVKSYPDLVKRTDVALRNLEADRQRLEQEAEQRELDKQVRAALAAITVSESTSLQDLQRGLEVLDKQRGYSQAVAAEVEAKRSWINSLIESLRQQVAGYQTRLGAAQSLDDVRYIRDEIVAVEHRVRGSDLEGSVAEAKGLATKLRAFFEEYGRIPTASPRSPEEANFIMNRLRELNREEILSEEQHRLILARVQATEGVVSRAAERAMRWLEEIEEDLRIGQDVFALDRRAADPPPFLPESHRPRLAELRERLETAKNSDLVAKIENDFNQLTDRAQQEAVAKRLWQRVFGSLPNGYAGERVLAEDRT